MCLSTVFARIEGQEDEKVLEYVCKIRIEGENITLTDIMGAETVVKGQISSCDFVNNKVIILSNK